MLEFFLSFVKMDGTNFVLYLGFLEKEDTLRSHVRKKIC